MTCALRFPKNYLFAFTVELRHQGSSHFLHGHANSPAVFASMEQAKRAARSAGAKKAYAAYDTIYDETGLGKDQQANMRFDYQKVDLSTYY